MASPLFPKWDSTIHVSIVGQISISSHWRYQEYVALFIKMHTGHAWKQTAGTLTRLQVYSSMPVSRKETLLPIRLHFHPILLLSLQKPYLLILLFQPLPLPSLSQPLSPFVDFDGSLIQRDTERFQIIKRTSPNN